jgi:hypothetical protein
MKRWETVLALLLAAVFATVWGRDDVAAAFVLIAIGWAALLVLLGER